ncbi:hypothetical protein ACFQY7_49345 [Actinomadura luteofluorescens]
MQTFTWAVLGVLQAAMYQWVDGRATTEELPEIVDRNLEFLGRGCPL